MSEEFEKEDRQDEQEDRQEEQPKVMRLKLRFKQKPCEIEDEDGSVKRYTLREISSPDRADYIDKIGQRTRYKRGNPAGMKTTAGIQEELIHLSMYDGNNKRVPKSVISKWPPTVITELYNKCVRLSALLPSDEEENESKND